MADGGTTISLLPVGAATPAVGVAGASAPIAEFRGGPIGATAVSALGDGRLAFNSGDGKFYVSMSGGAYTPLAVGGASPWSTAGGIISEVTLTDTVSMGSAAAVAGRKVYILETGTNRGIRIESAAPTSNVLDYLMTGNAQTRIDMTGQHLSFGSGAQTVANHPIRMAGPDEGSAFKLGDGTAPPDVSISRTAAISGAMMNVNVGAVFGGGLYRIEPGNAGWYIETYRAAGSEGGLDHVYLQSANAIATSGNNTYTAGAVNVIAGNSAAFGVSASAGAFVNITAGNAAQSGAQAANGGNIVASTGLGAGLNSYSGNIILQDSAAAGVDTIPPVDNAGKIGSLNPQGGAQKCFAEVNSYLLGLAERVALPGNTANVGKLYTKDVTGVTQLFYLADDNTEYQITPTATPGDTPWLRTGTTVALDQTGDLLVTPFDNVATEIGYADTATPANNKLWTNVHISGAFYVWDNTNSTAFASYDNNSVNYGPGGAGPSPADTGIRRTGVAEFSLVNPDTSTSAGLFPSSTDDAAALLGRKANLWRSIATGKRGLAAWNSGADAFPRVTYGTAITFSDGTNAPDVNVSRGLIGLSAALYVDTGAQFGGTIQRLENSWLIRTARLTAGAGDDITVMASSGAFSGPGNAVTGGIASLISGNAGASGAAQADGAYVSVTAGEGASGVGGGAANGGNVYLNAGLPGANGGSAGEVVARDGAGTGVNVVPGTDNSGAIGTAAVRWASVNIASTGARVYAATADANPTASLASGQLNFGPGGAAATDVALSRTTTPILALDINTGAVFGGPLTRIEPGAGGWTIRTYRGATEGGIDSLFVTTANAVATSGNNTYTAGSINITAGDSAAFGNSQSAGANVNISAGGAAQSGTGTAVNGGNIFVSTGPGAGGGVSGDVVIQDTNNAGVNVVPPSDGVGSIGTAALRFNLVRAVNIVSGDICFDDQTCRVCGQPFQEGEDLVMRVIRIEPDGDSGRRLTRTVPAHHGCR